MADDPSQQLTRLQQRVDELEMLVLHHQRDFSTLNEVVVEQSRALEQLKRQVDTFNDRLKYWQQSSDEASAGEEPPPPHY